MDNFRVAATQMSAALLGSTIESMQLWDILRSIDYLVEEEKLKLSSISLYGRKQMGGLALHAAALDDRITRVILEDVPGSHWQGPPLLGVLRVTDLARSSGSGGAARNRITDATSGIVSPDECDFSTVRPRRGGPGGTFAWGCPAGPGERNYKMTAPSRRQFLRVAGSSLAIAAMPHVPLFGQEAGERPQRTGSGVTVLNPRGRVPVSLIIDDSTCLVNLAHFGIPQFAEVFPDRYRQDWKAMPREIPDSFVRKFGEWCHENGVKGKYSIVPYPACVGWVDRDIPGWSKRNLDGSLDRCGNSSFRTGTYIRKW